MRGRFLLPRVEGALEMEGWGRGARRACRRSDRKWEGLARRAASPADVFRSAARVGSLVSRGRQAGRRAGPRSWRSRTAGCAVFPRNGYSVGRWFSRCDPAYAAACPRSSVTAPAPWSDLASAALRAEAMGEHNGNIVWKSRVEFWSFARRLLQSRLCRRSECRFYESTECTGRPGRLCSHNVLGG